MRGRNGASPARYERSPYLLSPPRDIELRGGAGEDRECSRKGSANLMQFRGRLEGLGSPSPSRIMTPARRKLRRRVFFSGRGDDTFSNNIDARSEGSVYHRTMSAGLRGDGVLQCPFYQRVESSCLSLIATRFFLFRGSRMKIPLHRSCGLKERERERERVKAGRFDEEDRDTLKLRARKKSH